MRRYPALLLLTAASAVHADSGPLIVPTDQTRSISGFAFAVSEFEGPINDSASDAAPGFGPFIGAAAADASVEGAIGSGGGQQSSTILDDRISAVGSMFATAESFEFLTSADGSALNRMSVTFDVTETTTYDLTGVIQAFDQGLAEVSLREGAVEIFGALIEGTATVLPIDESGTLQPGPHTLELRLEASVFGSDFFSEYASAEFDVELRLGAPAEADIFPETLLALDKTHFGWSGALPWVVAIGEFGDGVPVGDFDLTLSTNGFGNQVNVDGTPDEGFWVLVRRDLSTASWISGGENEVRCRDDLLP